MADGREEDRDIAHHPTPSMTHQYPHSISAGSVHKLHRSSSSNSRVHQIVIITRLISLLEKQHVVVRNAMLSAAFYHWRYSTCPIPPTEASHASVLLAVGFGSEQV